MKSIGLVWQHYHSILLTVHIQPGAVAGSAGPVGGRAGEQTAVLHHSPADVDVADHLAVHRHVLANHVPDNQQCSAVTMLFIGLALVKSEAWNFTK